MFLQKGVEKSMCRVSDFRQKEVINIKDGSRLGYVDDVEFEVASGQIIAIIIYGQSRFFGLFGKCDDYIIPWCDIEKIGEDTVLVCFNIPQKQISAKRTGFFASLFK